MSALFVIKITLLCVLYHMTGLVLSLCVFCGATTFLIYVGYDIFMSAMGLFLIPLQICAGIWAITRIYVMISETSANRLSV